MAATGSTLVPPVLGVSAHRDLHSVLQRVETIHRDHVAGVYSFNRSYIPICCSDGNCLHRYRLIRLQDIDKRLLRVALNRDCRNQNYSVLRVNQQTRIHELIRKQRVVLVRENCFELDRAGCRVDLVVESKQCARRELGLLSAIERIDCEPAAAMQLLPNLRQVIFSNTKEHVYGFQLRDDEHAVCISGMNDVAGIDETQTDASGNRRCDPAIRKVDLCGVDLSLIDVHDAFVLMDGRDLRVELLLRNRVFTESELIASQIDVRIFEQRLVALILPFSLLELCLEWTRIDLRQQVTLFDHLAFAVVDTDQLAIDTAFDGHRVPSGNRPERVDVNADASLLRNRGGDRDAWRRWL